MNGNTFLGCEEQGTENPSVGIQVNDLTYSTSLGLAREKISYPMTKVTQFVRHCGGDACVEKSSK